MLEYHFIITLKFLPNHIVTHSDIYTWQPGDTRRDIFMKLNARAKKLAGETGEGSVLFFSLEPNRF
jgi:hypothetical protein